MEPYYNPVLKIIQIRKKMNELDQSSVSEKDKSVCQEIYNRMIIEAKSIMRLQQHQYAFHIKKDGFNEVAKFVNKQLTFSAIDLPVNVEIVAV